VSRACPPSKEGAGPGFLFWTLLPVCKAGRVQFSSLGLSLLPSIWDIFSPQINFSSRPFPFAPKKRTFVVFCTHPSRRVPCRRALSSVIPTSFAPLSRLFSISLASPFGLGEVTQGRVLFLFSFTEGQTDFFLPARHRTLEGRSPFCPPGSHPYSCSLEHARPAFSCRYTVSLALVQNGVWNSHALFLRFTRSSPD